MAPSSFPRHGASRDPRAAHDAFDEIGRRTSSAETSDSYAGLTTTWTYDQLSRVLTQTDPTVTDQVTGGTHRQVTTNTYDANENLASTVVSDAVGGDTARTTTYNSYDNNDQLTQMTDPASGVWLTSYDTLGNKATSTDAAGTVTTYSYTPRNELQSTVLKDFVVDPIGAPTTKIDVIVEQRSYDPAGRLASITDALPTTKSFTYFDDDRLATSTLLNYVNPDNTQRNIALESYSYDADGNVTQDVTAGIRTTAYTWSQAGELRSTTVSPGILNRTTTNGYDLDGNLTSAALSDGTRTETTATAFDTAGRATSVTVSNDATANLVTTYGYDQRGLPTSVVDPRTNTTTMAYDQARRLKRVTSPSIQWEAGGSAPAAAQPVQDTGYNTFGDTTRTKDANGNVIVNTIDALGRTTKTTWPSYTIPAGGTTYTPNEQWVYDPLSRVTSHTDRRSQVTGYTYDQMGNLLRTTDPLITGQSANGFTRSYYDALGQVTQTTDQLGANQYFTYDLLGRARTSTVVETKPTTVNLVSTRDYDDLGDLTKLVSPLGSTTTAGYNPAGELTSVTNPRTSLATTLTRDVAGRLTRVTDPLNRATATVYDLAGRATALKHYDHNGALIDTTAYVNDASGNQTSITTPLGWTTTRAFDAANRLTSITEPIDATTSTTTRFGYDKQGNRTRVTDGRGTTANDPAYSTITTYQVWNQPQTVVEPSTTAFPAAADRTWTYTYNGGGLVSKVDLPGIGISTSFTFDQLSRVVRQTGTGAEATTVDRTYGYDLASDLTSFGTPTTNETLSYNDRAQIIGAAGPAGSATLTYDNDSRLASRTDAAGTANFTYYADDLISTVTENATNATRTYSYDNANQLSTISLGAGNVLRTYGWDDLGRETTDNLTKSSTTLYSASYTYDADSNVKTKTVGPAGVAGAGTNTYNYDRSERLSSWISPASTTTNYAYDLSGNRTQNGSVTSTYDARNRLLSDSSGNIYTYRARGGTNTIVNGANTTTMTFDAFDRLISDKGITYTYDSLDRPITSGAATFTYAGAAMEPSSDGSGTYVRDPGGDVIADTIGATKTAVIDNNHGDIVGTVVPTASTLTDTRNFDPWGVASGSTGTVHPSLGYQGSWTNPTTQRVAMEARTYNPASGTFTTRDTFNQPITGSVTANRYIYANGNPLSYMDRDGNRAGHGGPDGGPVVIVKAAAAGLAILGFIGGALVRDVKGLMNHGPTGPPLPRTTPTGTTMPGRARTGPTSSATTSGISLLAVLGGIVRSWVTFAHLVKGLFDPYFHLDWRSGRASRAGQCKRGCEKTRTRTRSRPTAGAGADGDIATPDVRPLTGPTPPAFNPSTTAANDGSAQVIGNDVAVGDELAQIGDAVDLGASTGGMTGGNASTSGTLSGTGLPADPSAALPTPLQTIGPDTTVIVPDGVPVTGADDEPASKPAPEPATDGAGSDKCGPGNYSRPSGFHAGVRDKVWSSAIEQSTGRVRDRVTGQFMSPNKPWDMGHKEGYEFRKHARSAEERNLSREDFIKEHNDPSHYRPELPSSNRRHCGEDKTDTYFGP